MWYVGVYLYSDYLSLYSVEACNDIAYNSFNVLGECLYQVCHLHIGFPLSYTLKNVLTQSEWMRRSSLWLGNSNLVIHWQANCSLHRISAFTHRLNQSTGASYQGTSKNVRCLNYASFVSRHNCVELYVGQSHKFPIKYRDVCGFDV